MLQHTHKWTKNQPKSVTIGYNKYITVRLCSRRETPSETAKSADTTQGGLRSPKIHNSLTLSTLVCTLKHDATTRERGKPVALCIHVLQKRPLHWGTTCVLTATQVKMATMKTGKLRETHSRLLGDSNARAHADPCHHQVQTYTRQDDEHI